MGNLCAKNNDRSTELEQKIKDLGSIIKDLKDQNFVLNDALCDKNSEFCYVNGILQTKNIDAEKLVDQEKTNKKYEYLVLSGGGIKGIAYCGALKVLEELCILQSIKGYAGTSAGSIVAGLLAIGYTSNEILDIMKAIDFESLVDDKIGYVRDSYNLIKDYGIAPGKTIYELMGDYIKSKTSNSDYTFGDLYTDHQISLVIVGTDLKTRNAVYFYHGTYPNMSIRQAIRISMSIPFLFEPVSYDNMLCVDGGLVDNYPLHVFDGDKPNDIKSRMNLCVPNHKVLGLNIMTDSDVSSLIENKPHDVSNLYEFCSSMLDTFMTELERRMMTPSYFKRTINIRTRDYDSTNFNLTDQQKTELMNEGEKGTRQFFKKYDIEIEIPEDLDPDTDSYYTSDL